MPKLTIEITRDRKKHDLKEISMKQRKISFKKIVIALSIFIILALLFFTLGNVYSILKLESKNAIKDAQAQPKEKKIFDKTFWIEPGEIYYYGGSYENSGGKATRRHIVSAISPLDIYVVKTQSDARLIPKKETFIHYPSWHATFHMRYDETCTFDNQGGIAIWNKDNENAASVTLQVYEVN